MGLLPGNILRDTSNGCLYFWCPGCEAGHSIRPEQNPGPGPIWTWNGSTEKPTFAPSIKVTYPVNPEAEEEFKEWRTERICHSYVTDGQIQFLSDCTHALAGQTVPLPEWPTSLQEPA